MINLEILLLKNNLIEILPIEFNELKNLSRITYRQKLKNFSVDNILGLIFKMTYSTIDLRNFQIEELPKDLPFNSNL